MLIGQYPCPLSADLRLRFPVDLAELTADDVYITQGFDRNLLVLTTHAFDVICQHIASLNIADPTARLLFRMVFGSASLLEVNPAGQFIIPKRLAEFANLKNNVIVLGQGNFCEIWSEEHWLEQEVQLLDANENTNRFSTLVITI